MHAAAPPDDFLDGAVETQIDALRTEPCADRVEHHRIAVPRPEGGGIGGRTAGPARERVPRAHARGVGSVEAFDEGHGEFARPPVQYASVHSLEKFGER